MNAAQSPNRKESPETRPRVLIVDDEPTLSFTLRLMLDDHYDVETVFSAEDAQGALKGDRFDVVLCDLQMPGMPGWQLHAWAETLDPGLARRFVFMTGGACSDTASRFLAREDILSLGKPFELTRLIGIVDHVVAQA